jgi:exopolyphosphatase/guanosine-5'-triphosphate,3'-diphosphate pyrophosphatase
MRNHQRSFWLLANFLTLLLTNFLSGTITAGTHYTPEITRAAFDIGSGTTKMTVAVVDRDTQKIVEVLLTQNQAVGYKEALAQSASHEFSDALMLQGVDALKALKSQAESKGAQQFFAVATAAFRDAKNSALFVDRIKKEIGIAVKVISQQEEGELGFLGAYAKTAVPLQNLVVWDIGGGSMQFTAQAANRFTVYHGDLASVSFKKHLTESIQKKTDATSPNPISSKEKDEAINFAREHAKQNVLTAITDRLKLSTTVVVGIGGVHFNSVNEQINQFLERKKFVYTLDELRKTVEARIGLHDDEIKIPYADVAISNLLLVLGYCEALGIKEVTAANINLNDAILINPEFWPKN